MKRRDFLKNASLLGAALAVAEPRSSSLEWRERRDLYPEGVASGDPHPDSVLLWTRRPPVNGDTASVSRSASPYERKCFPEHLHAGGSCARQRTTARVF